LARYLAQAAANSFGRALLVRNPCAPAVRPHRAFGSRFAIRSERRAEIAPQRLAIHTDQRGLRWKDL
jgi:hypothetical protein